jgi:hypothetical protein
MRSCPAGTWQKLPWSCRRVTPRHDTIRYRIPQTSYKRCLVLGRRDKCTTLGGFAVHAVRLCLSHPRDSETQQKTLPRASVADTHSGYAVTCIDLGSGRLAHDQKHSHCAPQPRWWQVATPQASLIPLYSPIPRPPPTDVGTRLPPASAVYRFLAGSQNTLSRSSLGLVPPDCLNDAASPVKERLRLESILRSSVERSFACHRSQYMTQFTLPLSAVDWPSAKMALESPVAAASIPSHSSCKAEKLICAVVKFGRTEMSCCSDGSNARRFVLSRRQLWRHIA